MVQTEGWVLGMCFKMYVFWKRISLGHHNCHQNGFKSVKWEEGVKDMERVSQDLERTNKFLVPIPQESPSLFKGWSEQWDCFACFWLHRAGRSTEGVGFLCVAMSHMESLCNISLWGKEWNKIMILCSFFRESLIIRLLLLEKAPPWHAEPATFLIADTLL